MWDERNLKNKYLLPKKQEIFIPTTQAHCINFMKQFW